MSLGSLLKKEFHWSRHNVLALLFVLLLLPAFFAYASVAFETVIPRDAPVAIVPESDAVTDDDLTIIRGGLAAFADPTVVESEAEATRMLHREAVYATLRVPPDITDADASATFLFTVDGSVVPFTEPSKAIRSIVAARLDSALAADVTVDRRVIGANNTLSEYLVPVFLMAILMVFAFTYVPYNLARESDVLDRLRTESSLEAIVGAKLVYFTLLMALPIAVFQAAAAWLGYAVDALALGSILAFLLTFVALAAISMAVTVVLRFGSLARFVNVVLLLGTVAFSGLAYPVGYFSPLRKAIVRSMPTHYAMIVARSSMLKGLDLALFADWLLGLAGFALLALCLLKLSATAYRRTA